MQSKPCPNCGRTLAAQATFCQYCGARFQPSGQRPPARPSSSIPPRGPANPAQGHTRLSDFSTARTRPPGPPPARSKPPAQDPGGPPRPRQRSAPPPSEPDAAPKKSNTRLILLLAAVIGILLGATIGVFVFTHKSPTTTANHPKPTPTPTSYVGTVSFTASGGLDGPFTLNLPKATPPASSIQESSTTKVLEVVVNSATMDFELGISPYPGPGTYPLQAFQTNPDPKSYYGAVRISDHQSTWSLHPPAQCQVTITSDTALNIKAQDKPLDEVKGSFSCPSLATDTGSAKALKVTEGQFDVYALVLATG